MSYFIKEIYYTLQGEGFHTGRPAVFCRFAGCNLWSGHEKDRAEAVCPFCDTGFVGTVGEGGGKYESASEVAEKSSQLWTDNERSKKFVVCTGGEPLLQMDKQLVNEFHDSGFEIAIETNGTRLPPEGIDWICVSPKAGAELVLKSGDELKLVYPQNGLDPSQFLGMGFEHFSLQPMDGPEIEKNTKLALEYCLTHPKWRLSLQTHKLLNIP